MYISRFWCFHLFVSWVKQIYIETDIYHIMLCWNKYTLCYITLCWNKYRYHFETNTAAEPGAVLANETPEPLVLLQYKYIFLLKIILFSGVFQIVSAFSIASSGKRWHLCYNSYPHLKSQHRQYFLTQPEAMYLQLQKGRPIINKTHRFSGAILHYLCIFTCSNLPSTGWFAGLLQISIEMAAF